MASLGAAGAGRVVAAGGKHSGACGIVGSGWATHRICPAVKFVHVQFRRKRFAGASGGKGHSFCAAIFSGRPPVAFHDPGYEPAHVFVVGSFSGGKGFASDIGGVEQTAARVWRGLERKWKILSV